MWDELWKIVLGVLASVGGVGVVIVAAVKFSADIIAKRLEEKNTLKMNKELEKYRVGLDNKIYISKTKFAKSYRDYIRKIGLRHSDKLNNKIPTSPALRDVGI